MAFYNLIVGYDLVDPGQKYDAVHERIESLGQWYRLQYSLFYVNSCLDPKGAHDHVRAAMDGNDRLAVFEATQGHISPCPKADTDAINAVWFSPGTMIAQAA